MTRRIGPRGAKLTIPVSRLEEIRREWGNDDGSLRPSSMPLGALDQVPHQVVLALRALAKRPLPWARLPQVVAHNHVMYGFLVDTGVLWRYNGRGDHLRGRVFGGPNSDEFHGPGKFFAEIIRFPSMVERQNYLRWIGELPFTVEIRQAHYQYAIRALSDAYDSLLADEQESVDRVILLLRDLQRQAR